MYIDTLHYTIHALQQFMGLEDAKETWDADVLQKEKVDTHYSEWAL